MSATLSWPCASSNEQRTSGRRRTFIDTFITGSRRNTASCDSARRPAIPRENKRWAGRRTDSLVPGLLVLEQLHGAHDAFTEVALAALDKHLRALKLRDGLLVLFSRYG